MREELHIKFGCQIGGYYILSVKHRCLVSILLQRYEYRSLLPLCIVFYRVTVNCRTTATVSSTKRKFYRIRS